LPLLFGVGRRSPAEICARLQGFVLSVELRWSETMTPAGSTAAPPSIKGLGAFLRSGKEKALPTRPVVVAGELVVVVDAVCSASSGRPWRRGEELGAAFFLFFSSCRQALSSSWWSSSPAGRASRWRQLLLWVGDCKASGSTRELLSGGLRWLAPMSRPDPKVVGQLLPCFSQAAPALSRCLALSGFVPGGGTVAGLTVASSEILEKNSEDLIAFCFRSRVSFALL
jgi:hypothetical protein